MNTGKGTIFLVFFTLLVLTGGAEAAHWIVGTVYDAVDGTPANEHTIIIYYLGDETHYVSDTIGSSGINNGYICDAEKIPGHVWNVGDVIYARVIDTGDGYTAGPVSVITSVGGFDQEPDMILQAPAKIVINEFFSNNVTEWVELYNKGVQAVNLTDWALVDAEGNSKSLTALGTIEAGGYRVYFTNNWLNNDGEIIWLINSVGKTIDQVGYGTQGDAPAPETGKSTGRCPNGEDTGDDAIDFMKLDFVTPGAANACPVDTEPPLTTYTTTPEPNAEGWNNIIPVNVTFFRSDPAPSPSGVAYTNYSTTSETGPWIKVDGEVSFNLTVNTEGETTIWFFSVDMNATPNVEAKKNVTVKIDIVPPGTVIGLGETDVDYTWIRWNWTNSVDSGSSGFAHVECQLDGAPVGTTTAETYTAEGLVANTTHELSVRAVDLAGNPSDWVNDTATTRADEEDPEVTVTAPVGGETWYASAIEEITWTATDNVGVTTVDIAYSTDGGVTYPNTIATGETNDGTYHWTVPDNQSTACRVKIKVYDAAWNYGEDASDDNFTIQGVDLEEPIYTWILRPTSATTGETTLVNLTAIDNVAVNIYTITIDGTDYVMTKEGTYYYTYLIPIPSENTANITYNCSFEDEAGNANTTADTVITVRDNDEPIVEWIARPESGTTGEAIEVKVRARDNIGVTQAKIAIDGTEEAMVEEDRNYSYTMVIPSESVEAIVYNCSFEDEAGNANTTADTVITVRDNDEPVIMEVDLDEYEVAPGEEITVMVTVADNVAVLNVTAEGKQLSLLSGTQQQGCWSGTITAPPDIGLFTLHVEARDAANNTEINDTVEYTTWKLALLDTGRGTYPSIAGVHKGTIRPNHTLVVKKLHIYSFAGTGGHAEFATFYNRTTGEEIMNATWTGYTGEDYRNLTFSEFFLLSAGQTYSYEISTGSYPQLILERSYTTIDGSVLNCTSFTDVNGNAYDDRQLAFKLYH